MAERELIDELAAKTGLLEPRPDKNEQRERVAKFTRMAAWLVRDKGWGNVKKTGGDRVQEKSVDKLIHRDTGVVVDIVGKSDGPTPTDPKPPRVSWTSVDVLDPKEFFVEPKLEPGDEPDVDEPKPPKPDDDDLAILLEACASIVDSLDKVSGGIAALLDRIDVLQKDGVKVRI